jgi:hypothetical protein
VHLSALTFLAVDVEYAGGLAISDGQESDLQQFTAALAQLQHLVALEVGMMMPDDDSAAAFASAVAAPPQLKRLRLSQDAKGSSNSGHAGALAMQAAVRRLARLSYLHFGGAFNLDSHGSGSGSDSVPLPEQAPQLAHVDLLGIWLPGSGEAAAEQLAALTALTHLGLPSGSMSTDVASAPATPGAVLRELPAACRLQRLSSRSWIFDERCASYLARLTQLKHLDFHNEMSGDTVIHLVPAVAALTALQTFRLPFLCFRVARRVNNSAARRGADEAAVVMAQLWKGLTCLSVLDLQGSDSRDGLSSMAASKLSVQLACLAPRLVPVWVSLHAQTASPMKQLPGGGVRLDLECIGGDDSQVDDAACSALAHSLGP